MKAQNVSIVIPVYQGQTSIAQLVDEIARYFEPTESTEGRTFVVSEVLLVHDCGPDRSDVSIRQLAEKHVQIKPIWLTKNFGQHAATLAGMSSATGDWIVTMDEDGQHDPGDIGRLLDCALGQDMQVVYAQPMNTPPHGFLRNFTSRLSKRIGRLMMGHDAVEYFHSYRMVQGEIARSLAAYCGHGVYLDVGLLWIAGRIGRCPVNMRVEEGRASGYTYSRLLAHFWTMLLTVGTRPLRLITLLGVFSVAIAVLIGVYAVYQKMSGNVQAQGWASLVIVVSFFSGCILVSLGMIAEYLAVSMGIAMGKPLYVVGTRSNRSN
ncbi:glycosyltransferase [Rhodoferax sp.]|uniref:glycosyltransferase n=1 Tax=Rhodoferax sp. TaxID=50421 RepID=UPI002ACDE17D|nr:glycosyltransferase [Rhodoferax sp.]MDZ7922002.1 glycosyltransferase [Rhodoferax sp.]